MTNRSKAVLWLVSVFLVGGLFGGATTYFLVSPQPEAARSFRPDPSKHKSSSKGRFMDDMNQELNMTPQQQEKVRKILEASRENYRTIWEEADQKSNQNRMHTRSLLMTELSPEQQVKFKEFLRRRDEERKKSK